MTIDFITKDELQALVREFEARLQRAIQEVQRGSQVIYTNDDLSRKLGVSKRTLQNWRDEGLIDYTQVGHKLFYTEEAIDTVMEKFKKSSFRAVQQK